MLSAPLISQDDGDQFPVVVFSHGLGTSFFIYSAICIDIASNGYVVAAVEHKDQSACIALRRVPKNAATQEGQYDRYVNEWIPYLNRPREDVVLRNQQVMDLLVRLISCNIRISKIFMQLNLRSYCACSFKFLCMLLYEIFIPTDGVPCYYVFW